MPFDTSPGGGGASAITQLSDVTLTQAAASLDSGTFATTKNHLLVVLELRHSTAELLNSPTLALNNDSSGVYDTQRNIVSGGAASADKAASNRGLQSWGDSATANTFCPSWLYIPSYASSTKLKNIMILTGGFDTVAGAGAAWQSFSMMNYNSTTAISRVVILPPSGNFMTGSRITVYGML